MSRDPNQRFEYELGRTSGSGPATFRLTVTDHESNLTVLEAEFDAEQFANLLSSRIVHGGVPTWFLPEETYPKIGKIRTVIRRLIVLGSEFTRDDLVAWAEDITRFAVPAEYSEVRRRGAADFEVFLVRHFPTQERADAWKDNAQKIFDTVPTPGELRQRAIELSTWNPEEN